MTGIVLTTYSGAILGPIAKILGWIMNLIYEGVYNLFGIESVALSILIITVVIYTALLPFTIKQQKFAKLQQKMQPEIQKIQEIMLMKLLIKMNLKAKKKNCKLNLRRQSKKKDMKMLQKLEMS